MKLTKKEIELLSDCVIAQMIITEKNLAGLKEYFEKALKKLEKLNKKICKDKKVKL